MNVDLLKFIVDNSDKIGVSNMETFLKEYPDTQDLRNE